MTERRRCSLVLSAVLLGAFALTASAQERRLSAETRDLARTRPLDRLHGDGFTPLHGTSGGLLDSDGRRMGSPLPGVAWTPGLPGGGGGSGGPWEPAVADSYSVGTVLPCLPGGDSCELYDASRLGRFLVGYSHDGGQDAHPCREYDGEPMVQPRVHGVVWELDASSGLQELHDLPNPVPAGGRTWAVAHAASDSGLIVGNAFLEWIGCDDGELGWSLSRPVAWSREPDGSWVQHDLPTGTDHSGAGDARGVNTDGSIVGFLDVDDDGDGETERAAVAWIPDSSETTGWRLEWLPAPDGVGASQASLVNDAGTIAGFSYTTTADGSLEVSPLAWQRSRFGRWLVAELPTLGGDAATAELLTEDGVLVGRSSTGVIEPGPGSTPDTEQQHATRWVSDAMSGTWFPPEDLGTLTGPRSWAFGQAGQGLVVGRSNFDARQPTEFRAVAWDEGVPVQLDAITVGRWTFDEAWEVLPSGRIVVRGFEGNSGPMTQLMILEPNAP